MFIVNALGVVVSTVIRGVELAVNGVVGVVESLLCCGPSAASVGAGPGVGYGGGGLGRSAII